MNVESVHLKEHSSSSALALTDSSTEDRETQSVEPCVDSLPYIDYLDQDYEAYALSLVEEEMKTSNPSSTHLAHLKDLGEKPIFRNAPASKIEYESLLSREGQSFPASKQMDFHLLDNIEEPVGPLVNDEHAWKESLRCAKIELERAMRINTNLEIQQAFEGGQWRLYNASLEMFAKELSQELQLQKRQVDEINAKRAEIQEAIAPKLQNLNRKWGDLAVENLKLATATSTLDAEVKDLKSDLVI